MKYTRLKRLRARLITSDWNQIKTLLRGLVNPDPQICSNAQSLLASFSYQDQAVIIRFLKNLDF
jgi:hypothetical protein